MTDWIALAEKHGAKFTEHQTLSGPEWDATCYRRGRAAPLFSLFRNTKEEAAQAYCEYIHLKVPT